MKVLSVIQHTSAEYLGLMEDHLEGRQIRFRYCRPFSPGVEMPETGSLADALVLLGGGPWGSAGGNDIPTLEKEIALARYCLEHDKPVIGIGLGAQILATAAGGGARPDAFVLEVGEARRAAVNALNGYLPDRYPLVVCMRDWPEPPTDAVILAVDEADRPALFQVGEQAFGFSGHPGMKPAMAEDLIMEFAETPENLNAGLEKLYTVKGELEDALVPIMTGLVQLTALMRP